MCGIAGISIGNAPAAVDPETALQKMVAALRHRGPDDEGYVSLPAGRPRLEVLLGNTRLAILDLTHAAHQPLEDPETGNWIVMNGEIYNHRDLRAELGGQGQAWRSRSDTETVLRAYALWGPRCLDRLRGMFALAIWDSGEGALWCARDRLGIKPFYCHASGGCFLFASEVRALLASGLVPRRIDRRALAGFLRFGSVPEPLTLVAQVESLAPGHTMRVRAGRVEELTAYWRPRPALPPVPPSEAAREVRRHLERSVREHLLSDVPVASFLSGGVDSSVVTALAARASTRPIRTFNVAFHEAELDESEHAQAVAARYSTEHHRVLLSDEDVAGWVPDAVRAMDLPSADGANTFVVSQAVSRHETKVVLSGLGGDELFGGYRSFRILPRAHGWASVLGRIPERIRRLAARGGSGERVAEMTARGSSLRERYETLRAFWSKRELSRFGVEPGIGCGAEDLGDAAALPSRISALELAGYMRSTLLRDGDGLSMAHSLEMRVPFLDHELVECCLALEAAASSWGRRPKALLLEAVGDLLPLQIGGRAKQGFVLPMDRWMRGPLGGFVADGLDRLGRSAVLPGVDIEGLQRRFGVGRLPWARLWQLAVLGHWLDRHLS